MKDGDDSSGGSSSFSIPSETADMVKTHLEKHGHLLGRPANRVGPFLAEAARILVRLDVELVEALLRIEKDQDSDPDSDPAWDDEQPQT